jgi:parvulin-like peptidyl-prolyl isomerase
VWAQTAGPARPVQPQAAPAKTAEPDSDAVIATFEDGKKVTYGELKSFIAAMPPQMQQAAMADRKSFVSQYALMRKLSAMAEENQLDQRSPTKEMLRINRMQVLTNAQVGFAMDEVRVPPEEIQKFYESNVDRFSQVQVKTIYIPFNPGPSAGGGAKNLTESEARIKIEGVLKQIRGGADFVKMVKAYSQDQTSALKDGDFGTIRRSDNLPDAVGTAIFALKEGQVSEPVRQPNGFYLFRAEKITRQALPQVRDEIFNELKQAQFGKWMANTQRALNVKFENEAFFSTQPAAPAAPAPAAK